VRDGVVRRASGIRLNAGEVFAGYTIVRLLGSGGMGEVYLAEHPRLPRREALKILGNDVSADDDYRRRFIREADLAAALWHPNIVRVNDRGEFNGQLWISMDFVDGTDAASLLRSRYPVGMPADQVATVIEAIASALDYAHQHHDLLHRDVNPANILLSKPGDGDQRILLGDFGIARNTADSSGLTATNMTIGTFPYAAPEQLTDEPIDGRADQYALAATAYHLLTGSTLFPHSNPAVVISHHLTTPPPALAKTRPKLMAFDPVLAVALAKDPADRFALCTDFARAFAEAGPRRTPTASASTMQTPLAHRPPRSTVAPSALADVDKQQRHRRWRIFAAASTVIAFNVVGAIGYTIENGNTASKQGPPAASTTLARPQSAPKYTAPPVPASQRPPPAPTGAPPPASPTPGFVQAPPAPQQPASGAKGTPQPASPTLASVQAAPAQQRPAPAPQRLAPAATGAPPPAPPTAAPVQAAPTYAPPAPAPEPPAPGPDEAFLSRLSKIPGVRVTDPARATAGGRSVCEGLQEGESPRDATAATVNGNPGITSSQADASINAAIHAYCPQYVQ
jgi:serine/threonine protein kinase, bacterial